MAQETPKIYSDRGENLTGVEKPPSPDFFDTGERGPQKGGWGRASGPKKGQIHLFRALSTVALRAIAPAVRARRLLSLATVPSQRPTVQASTRQSHGPDITQRRTGRNGDGYRRVQPACPPERAHPHCLVAYALLRGMKQSWFCFCIFAILHFRNRGTKECMQRGALTIHHSFLPPAAFS